MPESIFDGTVVQQGIINTLAFAWKSGCDVIGSSGISISGTMKSLRCCQRAVTAVLGYERECILRFFGEKFAGTDDASWNGVGV